MLYYVWSLYVIACILASIFGIKLADYLFYKYHYGSKKKKRLDETTNK
jgi:hypothetical protein